MSLEAAIDDVLRRRRQAQDIICDIASQPHRARVSENLSERCRSSLMVQTAMRTLICQRMSESKRSYFRSAHRRTNDLNDHLNDHLPAMLDVTLTRSSLVTAIRRVRRMQRASQLAPLCYVTVQVFLRARSSSRFVTLRRDRENLLQSLAVKTSS